MDLRALLLVAIGGALGSVARFVGATAVDARWSALPGGAAFPVGTLTVNLLGGFAIGLIAGLSDKGPWQQFLITGILGGFTTFSAFSLQSVRLAGDSRWGALLLYIGLSVAGCLLACWAGLALATVFQRGR